MARNYRGDPDWKQIKAVQRAKAASPLPTDPAYPHPDDIIMFTEDKVVAFGDFLGPAFLIYEYHKARGEHVSLLKGERRVNRRRRSNERLFKTSVFDASRGFDVYLRVSESDVYEYGRVEHLRD